MHLQAGDQEECMSPFEQVLVGSADPDSHQHPLILKFGVLVSVGVGSQWLQPSRHLSVWWINIMPNMLSDYVATPILETLMLVMRVSGSTSFAIESLLFRL